MSDTWKLKLQLMFSLLGVFIAPVGYWLFLYYLCIFFILTTAEANVVFVYIVRVYMSPKAYSF